MIWWPVKAISRFPVFAFSPFILCRAKTRKRTVENAKTRKVEKSKTRKREVNRFRIFDFAFSTSPFHVFVFFAFSRFCPIEYGRRKHNQRFSLIIFLVVITKHCDMKTLFRISDIHLTMYYQ